MCYNLARAHEMKGDPRAALPWYERGVAYERIVAEASGEATE